MTRDAFARAVLAALGIPARPEAIKALEAWMQAEGTSAANNPLATTQPWSGSSNFNSVGVKNYASEDDGVAATVRTLTNGLYNPILGALQNGTAMDVAQAVAASPWGTGTGVIRVLGGQVSGTSPIGSGGSSGSSKTPTVTSVDPEELKQIFVNFVGREPTGDELARYGGKSVEEATKDITSTQESQGFGGAVAGITLRDLMANGGDR